MFLASALLNATHDPSELSGGLLECGHHAVLRSVSFTAPFVPLLRVYRSGVVVKRADKTVQILVDQRVHGDQDG